MEKLLDNLNPSQRAGDSRSWVGQNKGVDL